MRRQPPVLSPLHTGAWLRAWPRLKGDPREELAQRLTERYATDGVLLTDSGTTALRLAIRAATPADGTVALPAFSCYDVATAAVGAGVDVVLYDLDPETLAPDPDSLRAALEAGAAAAVIAPLYGIPVDWSRIAELADEYGATLIEDAAQGHGASWHGRPLGSLGPLSVLSFGRGKGWTGSGGGALLWRGGAPATPPLESPAAGSTLRAAGVGLAQAWLARPRLYWIPASIPALGLGETSYREPGPPMAMTPFQAALLLETEVAADQESETRRARGAVLHDRLAEHFPLPGHPAGCEAGYLRFPILVPGGVEHLADPAQVARLGIAPSYPEPLDRLAAIRTRLRSDARLPGAEQLARELVTLPVHGWITEHDRERAVRLVKGIRG